VTNTVRAAVSAYPQSDIVVEAWRILVRIRLGSTPRVDTAVEYATTVLRSALRLTETPDATVTVTDLRRLDQVP